MTEPALSGLTQFGLPAWESFSYYDRPYFGIFAVGRFFSRCCATTTIFISDLVSAASFGLVLNGNYK